MDYMIPASLDTLLTKSLEAVRSNEGHDLNLGFREAIFWEFGPYRFSPGNEDASGHLRRVALAVTTVDHVLPIWKALFNEDTVPSKAIEESKRIVRQKNPRRSAAAISKKINAYWEHVEDLMMKTDRIEGAVGFAAVRALSLALSDGFTNDQEIDFDRLDSDEFTSNNTEFFAAAAYARGPVYPIRAAPASDPKMRKEFWEWWLRVAVPEAWNAK
jgi:hypothetical protein